MSRKEIFERAVKHIQDVINSNEELYLAQIIKMNPDINLLEYSLCSAPFVIKPDELDIVQTGSKIWLEKL